MQVTVHARATTAIALLALAIAGCGSSSGNGGGSSSTSTSTTSTTPKAASGPDGAKLFASNGCSGCHTLKAAGSTGTTGPNLDTQLPKDAKDAGKDLAAFTEESITKPGAYIAKGFNDGIMPTTFGSSLKPDEIQALVAYVTG